jgi:hypothetical protein
MTEEHPIIERYLMQKISKTIIHLWISGVSLGAFVFSWIFLVHSPKPAPLVVIQPLISQSASTSQASLEPIPSLNDFLKAGSRPVQTAPNTTTVRPRLRTRGS